MELLVEFRRALFAIFRRPAVACAILITLAVALGLNAAAFAVFDALVVRPYAVPGMERLVTLFETRRDTRLREPTSMPNFADWKAQTRTLAELTAYTVRPVEVGDNGDPERLLCAYVSANLFQIAGMTPSLG